MTRAAQILYDRLWDKDMTSPEEAKAIAEAVAAEVKEAWRATIEQETANEDVRRAQRQGFCPTCGSDWR